MHVDVILLLCSGVVPYHLIQMRKIAALIPGLDVYGSWHINKRFSVVEKKLTIVNKSTIRDIFLTALIHRTCQMSLVPCLGISQTIPVTSSGLSCLV